MSFSNRTIYDKERLIRFYNFNALRKRFSWFLLILGTVLFSVAFALAIARNNYGLADILVFTLVMVMDIALIFRCFILPRITVKKSVSLNTDLLFDFQEETFKISATTKSGTETAELNYSSIIKVMESDRDIYLYTSIRRAYILDKSGFNLGCSDEFLKFLNDKSIPYKK